jgi:hypothetical protein
LLVDEVVEKWWRNFGMGVGVDFWVSGSGSDVPEVSMRDKTWWR